MPLDLIITSSNSAPLAGRLIARRALIAASALSLLALGACADSPTSANAEATETLLADAMQSTPVGFSSTESSYSTTGENDSWRPLRRRNAGRGGPFGSAFGTDFMGGGLGTDFRDAAAFRAGSARGPFGGGTPPSACSFEESSGKLICTPTTDRSGLTVERWVIYTDVDGNVQRAPDSTTFSRQSHAEVSGTVTVRDSATRTVRHVSDRLITGLQKGSTQRTVDGTSNGTETVNGFVAEGAFVAQRTVADTTSGLIIPVLEAGRSYPIAGTVIRSIEASVSIAGGAAETASWREVLTYDGSATATLVITRNGETKTCSVPLPMGRPVCQ
jgi:hypothetical protein